MIPFTRQCIRSFSVRPIYFKNWCRSGSKIHNQIRLFSKEHNDSGVAAAKIPFAQFKEGSMLKGLTFVSRRERLYAARKMTCDQKSTGQAFHMLNDILKDAKIKETLFARKRHVKKSAVMRMKLNRHKKHLFDNTVFVKSRKLACIDECIGGRLSSI